MRKHVYFLLDEWKSRVQESGEKEAIVSLYCPMAAFDEPKVRKVKVVFATT